MQNYKKIHQNLKMCKELLFLNYIFTFHSHFKEEKSKKNLCLTFFLQYHITKATEKSCM